MLGTRDNAARKFAELVRFAQGNSYIVYQALSQLDRPTENEVKRFISERLSMHSSQRKDTAA